jgi:hypothetical protein
MTKKNKKKYKIDGRLAVLFWLSPVTMCIHYTWNAMTLPTSKLYIVDKDRIGVWLCVAEKKTQKKSIKMRGEKNRDADKQRHPR